MTNAPSPQRRRVRVAVAAVAVVTGLLTVSALLKSATCTCEGPGVAYSAIALVSGVTAVAAFIVYAWTGRNRGNA